MKISLVVEASVVVGVLLGVASTAAEFHWLAGGGSLASLLAEGERGPRPALPPAGGLQPKVVVDREVYDFGAIERGTSQSHAFVFTNRGDYPLELIQGETTCQCTISQLEVEKIAPGKSATVTLQWEAKRGGGKFRQSATIWTNDPLRPRVDLSVVGRITRKLQVTPAEVVFSSVKAGRKASAEVRLISLVDENLEVLNHQWRDEATAEFFDVKVEPLALEDLKDPLAKSGALITVTVKPGLTVGSFDQSLELLTNSTRRSSVRIPIRGRVVGDISLVGRGWNAEQSIWALGTIKSSEGARRELTIFVRGENAAATTFEVVKATPEILQVSFGEKTEIKQGQVVKVPLVLEIPKGIRNMARLGPSPSDLGEIIIKTSNAEVEQLRLFVKFVVEP